MNVWISLNYGIVSSLILLLICSESNEVYTKHQLVSKNVEAVLQIHDIHVVMVSQRNRRER